MPLKKKKDKIIKNSQQESSTQPYYVDSDGTRFTAADVVGKGGKKFTPKKPYKAESISKIVSSPEFGKIKKNKN